MAQVVEQLPSLHDALNSIHGITKKKKQKHKSGVVSVAPVRLGIYISYKFLTNVLLQLAQFYQNS
jgi:hypothetical protein